MKKKKRVNGKVLGGIAVGAFSLALIFSIVGLSNTVEEIDEVSIAETPSAILASAGVAEGRPVSVPVLFYDQKEDECVNLYDLSKKDLLEQRQFEWTECYYLSSAYEQGMVDFELNDQSLPVVSSGELTPNRGLSDTTRWFSVVDGKSASYTGDIQLDYDADTAEFSFYKEEFYPLDKAEFSKSDKVNRDGHNHLFTMNFAVPFTVLSNGCEAFDVIADDDTFVFVGNKLVLDMGGIHDPMTGVFEIHENGEVYVSVNGETMAYSGVNVTKGESSIVRIFHADRDSRNSTFNVRFIAMNLAVVNSELANKEGGLQVAYDPSDPMYVAPLGESKVFKPSGAKGLIVVATIEGAALIAFSIFAVLSVKVFIKRKNR